MVGNIGQMLGVANEVRITCHPFNLETLFCDPLLTLLALCACTEINRVVMGETDKNGDFVYC